MSTVLNYLETEERKHLAKLQAWQETLEKRREELTELQERHEMTLQDLKREAQKQTDGQTFARATANK